MNMSIQNNLAAMNANRMFNITTGKKVKSAEKLSSGYRINRAADDAAGLAISEKMRRQIRGLTQGVRNCQDGISICQVADGALNEVHDILHRMNQLSVQAANGTLDNTDRSYLQQEVTGLLSEIDRISDDTEFNEIKIFKGENIPILNPDGTPASESNLNINDFKLGDLTLGYNPFDASSSWRTMNFQAVVDNPSLAAHGKVYNLIYGNGNTSFPSIVIGDEQIDLSDMIPTNYSHEPGSDTWKREIDYVDDEKGIDLKITQTITINQSEKYYEISGAVNPNSGNTYEGDIRYIFHADTAYNNNDRCEGYFTGGSRIERTGLYSSSVPGQFSIVDQEHALAFSESLSLGSSPEKLSIGYYYENYDWNKLKEGNGITGQITRERDLGFAAVWKGNTLTGVNYSLHYGIAPSETDPNIGGNVTRTSDQIITHNNIHNIYIQSGVEAGSGLYVTIGEMNTGIIGVRDLRINTQNDASNAIKRIKSALAKISEQRSTIGAQQNRLEHTIRNENNIIENTTAAESQIRDTDMAREMVDYSNHSVLEQAGASMLAQTNQSRQGLLQLLQ